MREQLIQYVNLLFAGAQSCEDIKQEILQNTLDRYDDLIAEGKVPEAAYRLAITGIGDINEILGTTPSQTTHRAAPVDARPEEDTPKKKRMRAIAIGIYIVAIIPLIMLDSVNQDILGLSLTLILVATATILLITNSVPDRDEKKENIPLTPQQEMRKSIKTLINTVGLVVYLLISFITQMWHITWLVFPIAGAVWQLVKAILDLKEAAKYEN